MLIRSLVILSLSLAITSQAKASGMVLHMWMADQAVSYLDDPDLKNLLNEQRDSYLYGSIFPDSGYSINHPYGEIAHWDGFMNAYHAVLGEDCPDLVTAACRSQFAHFLGSISHALGDINFDRHFVTAAAQIDYAGDVQKSHRLLDAGLDMIALIEHGRAFVQPLINIPVATLYKAFNRLPGVQISQQALRSGAQHHRFGMAGEPLAATVTYHYFKSNLPWASAQMVDAPGGIKDTARKIAAMWRLVWQARHGDNIDDKPFVTRAQWPQSDFWVYGHDIKKI